MTATIYEVAKRSGVSIGTVSRVLNDSPLTAVATRARVLQVIKELNYQPLALAKGLAPQNQRDRGGGAAVQRTPLH
jgi:DNA-binding LacI/PurR family transcriptional regulator